MNRLARWLMAHRTVVGVAVLLTTLVALVGLGRLGFDFTPTALFEYEGGDREFLDRHLERYGKDDTTVLVVLRTKDVFAPNALRSLRRLLAELGSPRLRREGVVRVSSMLNQKEVLVRRGTMVVGPLVQNLPKSAAERSALRRMVLGHPMARGFLVSKDATIASTLVELDPKLVAVERVRPLVERIEAVAARESKRSGLEYRVGGIPYVRVDVVRFLIQNQIVFIGLCLLMYILVLWVIFRSLHGVIVPLLTVGVAVIWGMSTLGWTGQRLDIINNVLPTLIFVIGASDAIHALVRYHEERRAGSDREGAIRIMLTRIGMACLLTSATTAIGFGSLGVAKIRILRDFGIYAAIGVMLAYLVTILVVPLLLSKMKSEPRVVAGGDRPDLVSRILGMLARTTRKRPKTVLLAGLLVTAVCGVGAFRVTADNRMLDVYRSGHPTHQTHTLLDEKLAGAIRLDVALWSKRSEAFSEPDVLRRVEALGRFVESLPGIRRAISLADVVKEMSFAMDGGKPGSRKIPKDGRLVTWYLDLYQSRAPSRDLERFVNVAYTHGRILAWGKDVGAKAFLRLVGRAQREADRLFPPATGVKARVTSTSLIAYRGINNLITDVFHSLMAAFLVIFLFMALLFRSFKLAAISVVPNVAPLLITLGVMGWAGTYLELSTVIVFSISLGIAVDDTIHFLSRYREELQKGAEVAGAVEAAIHTSGRAMLYTTVLLLAGCAVLSTSSFVPTLNFAWLVGTTLLAALLGDLWLLPALMLLLEKRKGKVKELKGTTETAEPRV